MRAGKTAWEREGGAALAEQLVAYRLFGHGSGQELGWSAATGSDERWGWYGEWIRDMAAFFGRDWRGDHTGRITGAPEECSWVGRERDGNSGPCLGVRQVYGVPSMVLRYAMDRWGEDYPGGERALVRRFTQSPARGFASLVDVSPDKSWGPEAIFTGFYITLWLDLQGWTTYMTTWDLQDIFDRLPENWQLKPYTSSSHTPRLTGRRVRAGSTLYFHWTPTGTLSPTSIKVTSPGGGRVPNHISVWALPGAIAGRAPIPRPARRGRTRRSPPFRLGRRLSRPDWHQPLREPTALLIVTAVYGQSATPASERGSIATIPNRVCSRLWTDDPRRGLGRAWRSCPGRHLRRRLTPASIPPFSAGFRLSEHGELGHPSTVRAADRAVPVELRRLLAVIAEGRKREDDPRPCPRGGP